MNTQRETLKQTNTQTNKTKQTKGNKQNKQTQPFK